MNIGSDLANDSIPGVTTGWELLTPNGPEFMWAVVPDKRRIMLVDQDNGGTITTWTDRVCAWAANKLPPETLEYDMVYEDTTGRWDIIERDAAGRFQRFRAIVGKVAQAEMGIECLRAGIRAKNGC